MRALSALFGTLLLGLTACNTEPQDSYCEAVCEWTTQCEADARPIDNTIHGECRDATFAVNSACDKAEGDGVDAATASVLTKCTDALTAATDAGECGGITGSYDELVQGAPPAACASQEAALETFTTARYATWEKNEELCTRFAESWCGRVDSCLVADLGDIPDAVWENLGGANAQEVCMASSGIADFVATCTTDSLYEREADLTSPNTARQGARECLGDLETLTCDEVLGGDPPEVCAASFTTTDQATSFAGGILDLATSVQDAMAE